MRVVAAWPHQQEQGRAGGTGPGGRGADVSTDTYRQRGAAGLEASNDAHTAPSSNPALFPRLQPTTQRTRRRRVRGLCTTPLIPPPLSDQGALKMGPCQKTDFSRPPGPSWVWGVLRGAEGTRIHPAVALRPGGGFTPGFLRQDRLREQIEAVGLLYFRQNGRKRQLKRPMTQLL